jgi:hypothetical protein
LLWAIQRRQGPSHGPGFGAKRAVNAAVCGALLSVVPVDGA